MHNRARATGARTAVLTIPQFALELVRKRRNRENSSLFAAWSTDAWLWITEEQKSQGERGTKVGLLCWGFTCDLPRLFLLTLRLWPYLTCLTPCVGNTVQQVVSSPSAWTCSMSYHKQLSAHRNRRSETWASNFHVGIVPMNLFHHPTRYWCDGLHCTPQGYDRMAEIIFATLEKYLWFKTTTGWQMSLIL